MPDATPRFTLLGPVRVHTGQGPLDVGGATARAVLAVLLIRGDAGLSTEEIIAAVWGEPGGATRDSAYHYLSAVRKVLDRHDVGAVLESRRPRYRLLVAAEDVDWHRFRARLSRAREARDRHELDRAAALLHEALDLWHGEPLADVGDRLGALRHDMAEQRMVAVETLATVEAQQGHPDEVVRLLRDAFTTGRTPVRETAAAVLIDALTALGRRDEAGEVYRRVYRRLADEHGLEPGPQLVAAHQRALQSPGAAMADEKHTRSPISGLPRPDRHFTDRELELRRLVDEVGSSPVCAVYGMGGSGKTALAVRAARALDDAYPDGVIFLDLHGYTAQRDALTPAEILDRLVRRMRVDGSAIPNDFDELQAFYHDLLDGRRLLLVLDNARDAAQVRPALPRPGGCAAIVTSRRRLTALDDVLVLPLDVLPPYDAMELFRAVADLPNIDGLRHIVELCGRLPLAIRIAAARHRAAENRSLAELEASLSVESERLAELDDDDRSVAASFRVSLDSLAPPIATTFLLLALHLDGTFDRYAAAALADLSEQEAVRRLRVLAEQHLILEPDPGRYQFHDLVAVFARQQALAALPETARTGALRRLADHYLRTAETADLLITPDRQRVALNLLDRAHVAPPLADYDDALRWLATENGNLLRACLAAASAGYDDVCWQLAYTLRGYYYLTKRWQPWIATHQAALEATRRLTDRRAEATITNNLGLARLEQGEPAQAAGHYTRARELFAEAGDEHGEHTARANLAWLHYARQDYEAFLDEMRVVHAFYVAEGSDRNAAITLRGIGLACAALGRIDEAASSLRTALEVFERIGLRLDAAMAFVALGELYQHSGDPDRAVDALRRAVDLARQSGSLFEQARAHHRLGDIAHGTGDVYEARRRWTLALEAYQELHAPEATQVRSRLAAS